MNRAMVKCQFFCGKLFILFPKKLLQPDFPHAAYRGTVQSDAGDDRVFPRPDKRSYSGKNSSRHKNTPENFYSFIHIRLSHLRIQ